MTNCLKLPPRRGVTWNYEPNKSFLPKVAFAKKKLGHGSGWAGGGGGAGDRRSRVQWERGLKLDITQLNRHEGCEGGSGARETRLSGGHV